MDVAGSGDWGGNSGLFSGAISKGSIGLGEAASPSSLGDNGYSDRSLLLVL